MARVPSRTQAQLANSIRAELTTAGSRQSILETEQRYRRFMAVEFPGGDPRALKHGYAFRLSGALARTVADSLRADFPTILPDADGRGGESPAPTGTGTKRLDVNYSTVQLGLSLGVSIKTLNFPDEASGRFTKNATRIDTELRAEAEDYHRRQPFCLMVGLVFVPAATTRDPGRAGRTSFQHIYRVLSKRRGRITTEGDHSLFEAIFLATYDADEASSAFGSLDFVEVRTAAEAPDRPPSDCLTFEDVIRGIVRRYVERNPLHRSRG